MDLLDAFGLGERCLLTAVGGGGKTSLVFGLVTEAADRDMSALATTTVKFTRPPGWPMPEIVEQPGDVIAKVLANKAAKGTSLTAISGRGTHGRMHGFEPAVIDGFEGLFDIVAVEGDGSGHRPFKAPAAHEPVIPSASTDVVVCVGLEVLGRPLNEQWVHRPEIVGRLAEWPADAPIALATILRVLLHSEGGRKGVPPGARLHALLNNPRTPDHEHVATQLAERLVYGGYTRAVVASAHRRGDVRAVVR